VTIIEPWRQLSSLPILPPAAKPAAITSGPGGLYARSGFFPGSAF